MDVKIALITGTVFAGVLVAGALAAPRGDSETKSGADSAIDSGAVDSATNVSGSLTSQSFEVSQRRDDDRDHDDDDDHDDDRHERDDDHREDEDDD